MRRRFPRRVRPESEQMNQGSYSRRMDGILKTGFAASSGPQRTREDYDLLAKAADHLWAKAMMSRSSVVLSLAKIAAESVVKKESRSGKH